MRPADAIRRANAAAASLKLPADLSAALSATTEALKAKLGRNADMWQTEAASRIR